MPASGGVDAEQHLREFGPAGAHETVDADDLAAAQRERNVFELTAATAQAIDAQQLGAWRWFRIFGNSWSTGRPTMSRMSSSPVTSLTLPALTETPSRNTA